MVAWPYRRPSVQWKNVQILPLSLGFHVNVWGRVQLILTAISPHLETSVPSSFHSTVNTILSLQFHPFTMGGRLGCRPVLLKPGAELVLPGPELHPSHHLRLGELDSALVVALMCC